MNAQELSEWRIQQSKLRRLEQRRKEIAAELRADPYQGLVHEAADVIDYLNERLKQADKDLREESRHAQRDAREAYDQGRADQRDRDERGNW